jgi:hypothetical protein
MEPSIELPIAMKKAPISAVVARTVAPPVAHRRT